MAKKQAAKKAAAKKAFKIAAGDQLKFKGYEDLPADMDAIFEKGDILVVTEVEGEVEGGQVKCKARLASNKKGEIDTVYVPGEAELHSGDKSKSKAATEDEDQDEEAEAEDDEDADEQEDDAEEASDDEDDADEDSEEDEDEEDEAPAAKKSKGKALAAPKEKKAPARTEEEGEAEEIVHMASVKKLLKKGDNVATAKELITTAEQSFFQLGGVLAEINLTKEYMELGYKADKKMKVDGKTIVVTPFEQFINAELGVEYRKAMYLVKIYKQLSKVEELDEARIAKIGWTKLRSIAKALERSEDTDLDALLDAAEEMTRDELEDHIKTSSVGGKAGEKVKKVRYTMVAFADEAEYIGGAIEKAQTMVEGGDVNSAMKHIFREWAMMADSEVSQAEAIKAVEARYGIKLALADETESKPAKQLPAPKKAEKSEKSGKVAKLEDAKKAKAKNAKAKSAPVKGKKRKAA